MVTYRALFTGKAKPNRRRKAETNEIDDTKGPTPETSRGSFCEFGRAHRRPKLMFDHRAWPGFRQILLEQNLLFCFTGRVPKDVLTFRQWLAIALVASFVPFACPAGTTAVAWGDGFSHQLDVPPDLTNGVGIVAGNEFTVALTSGGR